MATNFCLPPDEAEKFKRAIVSGEITPEKLISMSSSERRQFFGERFGKEAAPDMNRLFEEKLLHKNQQQAMISWAQRMMAGEKYAPQRKDLIARIQGMKEVLTPENEDAFLEELASYKLGTRVSYEEAKNIADLSAKIEETKAAMEAGGDRMEYGRAVVDLRNYVSELTTAANKLELGDFKRTPLKAVGQAVKIAADNAKAINASFDNSALFRQGLKVLLTHPGVWQRNARQSFVDLYKAFGAHEVMNEVNADIFSRPTYPQMVQAGLDVGIREEMFPSSLPEKVPVLGRAYKASEQAFGAFQRRTRADVFDKYLQIAKDTGVNLNDPAELQGIGKLVNSLTGRGHMGKAERVASSLNTVFFSPRMVKSQVDTMLLHPLGRGGVSKFAQKEAAKNLLKIILGIGAVLAIAKILKPDSVYLDPRSADFGKIKVGNTRFDVSGGMSSLVTLAAREATGSTKSSTTGKMTDLDAGKFGQSTREDVLLNYVENKFSPVASVVRDLLRARTFEGKKPTLGYEVQNLTVPLPFKTYAELKNDPKSAPILAAMIAESLGISTNDYGVARK